MSIHHSKQKGRRKGKSAAQRKKAFIARNLYAARHGQVMAYLYDHEAREIQNMIISTNRVIAMKKQNGAVDIQ
ncbi:hypothetical protein [Chitinophaga rhizophila]|uniref:50S ribosomal protein L20 n=1 Tax=Chitinophaga rhizophila TaxID=2866212 RepID=A0ABS7GFI4_9BACT|nr:hypothetical protein [Chitinophaga rhizophila]MBW8685427.1 hypothetical protein [Chitinophaga rhizophila]